MKKPFISIFLLLATLVHSQELIVHELDAPNAPYYSDLEVLRPILEDKQIVMLGEMTHMYGNIFEMKARVMEFLHKELGFTTFAMESPIYEIWKMNQKGFSPEAFNSAIFNVWHETVEFQKMVKYIEEHKLKVIGFDSQFFESNEFIDEFFEFCKKNKIRIRLDEDDFGIAIEEVLDFMIFEEDDFSFLTYKKELERIIKRIKALPDTEENFYWLQFTKSVLASSNTAYDTEEVLSSDFVNKSYNYRDAQMGGNLLAYIKKYPEEKIIVWADNIHLINDMSSYTQPIIKEFKSMGTYISKALGDKAYSLATLHANDSLYDNYQEKWFKTPIAEDSFEAQLLAKNKDYLFIDSNQTALKQPLNSRLLSFVDFYEGRVDQLHDGYIFLKQATLAEERFIVEPSNSTQAQFNLESLKNSTEEIKSTKFTGKLIDAKTEEPVPYVNLMLKETGVYRMTDQNGNYTLDLPIDLDKKAKVTFSSMGYEEYEITLQDLKEVIELTPSFESLSEVILVGHSLTPRKVLQKAIQNIKENYVQEPFNYERYRHYTNSKFDKVYVDVELTSKEYVEGYKHEVHYEPRIEQVKWNVDLFDHKNESFYPIRVFWEDAVHFANVLHKRKYKKFDLEFVISDNPKYQDVYIIKFKTNKNRFGYINRWYPSEYSGELYINKEDYAIIKVIQNWESTILEGEVKKVFAHWFPKFKEKHMEKEEYISEYQKHADGKYYASNYFSRNYWEYINLKDEFVNYTIESTSKLYNYSQENLEVLHYDNRVENSDLNRVEYNSEFWESYNPEEMMEGFW